MLGVGVDKHKRRKQQPKTILGGPFVHSSRSTSVPHVHPGNCAHCNCRPHRLAFLRATCRCDVALPVLPAILYRVWLPVFVLDASLLSQRALDGTACFAATRAPHPNRQVSLAAVNLERLSQSN